MLIKGAFYAALLTVLTQSAWAVEQGSITLDQAIAQALDKSPVLGASQSRAEAAIAAQSRAGALPNPEISVEAENIYGKGTYKDLAQAEITYGVSQLIELPGKRSNRIRVAEKESSRLHYTRDASQLDLIRDVTVAYAEAVAAEREMAIRAEENDLAAEVRDSVSAKVQAGRQPAIQKNKAEIELSASAMAYDRAKRQVKTKRQALSALIGEAVAIPDLAPDSLPDLSEPEPFDVYELKLKRAPDIQILEAEVGQAQAALSLEKAVSLPDPTIGLGVRQIRETDSQAMVASVSFPLPVFNLNRAGIAQAGHTLNATKLDQRGKALSLETQLTQIYEDYQSAYQEANILKKDVLPGAEQAFDYARGGYDAGKFGYLEVLDAQRTLFETRKQYNAAILEYYRQRAAIERMTASRTDHENYIEKVK